MKTLILVRHAKADQKAKVKKERSRPISKKGARLAKYTGDEIRARMTRPQFILASPVKKATQTVDLITHEIKFQGKIKKHESLYMAEADDLLKLVRKLPEDIDCALIVGHNPGLESLIPLLTQEIIALPHAGMASISLPVERWKDVRGGLAAQLVEVWDPRQCEEKEPPSEKDAPENNEGAGA